VEPAVVPYESYESMDQYGKTLTWGGLARLTRKFVSPYPVQEQLAAGESGESGMATLRGVTAPKAMEASPRTVAIAAYMMELCMTRF
jgi:hypothetical protein